MPPHWANACGGRAFLLRARSVGTALMLGTWNFLVLLTLELVLILELLN